jgi:DNA-binding transcriptional LysR family regulator
LTDLVIPTLIELKREHPELLPEHLNVGPSEANSLLVRGKLEAAFYYEELTAEDIVVERLGKLSASIYCGRGHPLFTAKKVTRADVVAHPFSVPRVGESGKVRDGWPTEVPRKTGMRIEMLRSNLVVSLSGVLLTVLPDITAAPHVDSGELRRLPVVEVPSIEVFAARHQATIGRRPAEQLIAGVAAAIESASALASGAPRRPRSSRKR